MTLILIWLTGIIITFIYYGITQEVTDEMPFLTALFWPLAVAVLAFIYMGKLFIGVGVFIRGKM